MLASISFLDTPITRLTGDANFPPHALSWLLPAWAAVSGVAKSIQRTNDL